MMITSVFFSITVTFTVYYLSFPALILGAPFALRRSEDRFDVTINDLHHMCEQNGLNLYESVLHFQMPYMNVSMTATKKIFEGISTAKSLDGLELLTEQHCKQNPDIRKYLQYLTDLVQTCMDENHRLESHKKIRVLDLFLKKVCSDIQYDALQKYDTNCFKGKRTMSEFVDCYGSAEPRGVVFRNDYILPIRYHPAEKECTGIFKYYECVVYSVQHCEGTTKNFVESYFEEKKSFSGCENTMNYL